MPGLIIAAPRSGSGKTVVTLGLLRHLRGQGRGVAAAKVGPDYIDATYLTAACGRDCVNLDSWAMRPATLAARIDSVERDAELVLCEGVMGLFDGAGESGAGSTAELAALSGWPVVLVVDIAGQAQSAAALVEGFARHRGDITIAGVVFNRVGGARHAALAAAALRRARPELPLLGTLTRVPALDLPSRHLGLLPAGEHGALDTFLDRAADQVAETLDLDALCPLARPATLRGGQDLPALPPLGQHIAIARDAAFAFAYPAMLEEWRRAGAELAFFSPLADEAPRADCDAVYLPGGYPELFAGQLAANHAFLAGTRAAAQRGAVVYGECGGYMVLGRALIDAEGCAHAMLGLLPLETSFAARRLHLGYRQAVLEGDGPLGPAGEGFRGHEFHYASIVSEGEGAPLFRLADADGVRLQAAGRVIGKVMGSFVHLIDRAHA
jgi:cobyrinic acid a,c-diamide synthase